MHLLSTHLSFYGVRLQWCSSPCKDLQRNLPIYLSRFKKSEAQEKAQEFPKIHMQRCEIYGRLHTLELDNNQIEDCLDIVMWKMFVTGLQNALDSVRFRMSFLLTLDNCQTFGAKPRYLSRIPLAIVPSISTSKNVPRIVHLQYNRLKGSLTQDLC